MLIKDRVAVHNTSGSTLLFETAQASPCKDHAPDPNPNTQPYPNPNHGDVQVPTRFSKLAILPRITPYRSAGLAKPSAR